MKKKPSEIWEEPPTPIRSYSPVCRVCHGQCWKEIEPHFFENEEPLEENINIANVASGSEIKFYRRGKITEIRKQPKESLEEELTSILFSYDFSSGEEQLLKKELIQFIQELLDKQKKEQVVGKANKQIAYGDIIYKCDIEEV